MANMVVSEPANGKRLLEQLTLTKLIEKDDVLKDMDEQAIERLHRRFHYHVCNWLQEQGFDTL